MQQILQIRPDDDIASIRARIESAELSRMVLIIPRDCLALESDRGLQLLRRAADDSGVEIGLVVHDQEVRARAEAFGFPVFGSLSHAQRTRWHMEPLAPTLVRGAGRVPQPHGVGRGGTQENVARSRWMLLTFGIVVALAICAAGVLFMPAANVRIVPSVVAVSTATDVLADPSIAAINSETRSIPARRITREISGTLSLKTTTEKSIPNAPSTGTVIFTNLRSEATLTPQGTIVKTSAGVPIRFTTTTTVTIPAGVNSRVEAPIQAVDPGTSGNVKELAINTIEGSPALGARVINLKPTASGSLKPVKVVTADDKNKLEAQLLQQLRQQGAGLLQQNLKPGEVLPAESVLLEVSDEIFDHVAGDPADVLNLRITAVVFGLAIDPEDTQTLLGVLLGKQLQAGYQLLPNSINATTAGAAKYQGIALRMPVRAIGYATPHLDTGKIARALQGKSADEARLYLKGAVNLAQEPELNITPIGWNRMPWFAFRIAVFVEPPIVSAK